MKYFNLINALKLFAYLWMSFFCPLNLFSQYNGTIPQSSVLTPNAAALFKVSQRPMGSNTGTVPIGIPLYTVAAGSLQAPVTLSYFNGGIGVQEVASWSGLGWNLAAGGRITRVMRGIPDDGTGGMLSATLKPSAFPTSSYLSVVDNVLRNAQDLEPDIFYFNFNGVSGKFYFTETGSVKMISQQPIKIEPSFSSGQITSWLITDNQGNRYYFGQGIVDQTNLNYSSINGYGRPNYGSSFISSWHLVEMRDMNDENTISFSYTHNTGSFSTSFNSYMVISNMAGADCSSNDYMGDEISINNNTDEYYLTKIQGRNDSLILHSSTNRKDYSGGRKLDSLSLFARNNQLRKRYHLIYDYFSTSGAPTGPGNDELYKRLKLTKLSEFGTAANDSLTHVFNYIESVNLPSRSSRGIDYWGFYNGSDYNSTLMPNGSYTYGMYTFKRENLGERRAQPYYSIANTLEKITFPTGGYRQFIYEGNTALIGTDSQIRPDAIYTTYRSFNENASTFTSPSVPIINKAFTINSTDGSASISYYMSYGTWYGGVTVRIFRVVSPGNEYEVTSFIDQISGSYTLNNGNYRMEVYRGYNTVVNAISCSWQEVTMPNTTITRYGYTHMAANMNVGGVRVKEVRDYDPLSSKTYKTKYKYYLPSDTTLTAGLLISPVRVAIAGSCGYPNRDCNYIKLTAESEYPLAKEGGSFVVYPDVKTIEEGNGYSQREYSFAFDAAAGYTSLYNFPIIPPDDASWKRGNLINEKVYNNNNQLLKHTYAEGQGWGSSSGDLMSSSQVGVKVAGFYKSSGCDHTSTGIPCQGCYGQYYLSSQFAPIKKTIEKIYNAGPTAQELTVEYDYYTSLAKPILKEQRIYLNNGSVKKINYRYAFNSVGDFVFGLTSAEQTIATALLAKNFLEPLEITTTLTPAGGSPVLTQGVKNIYDYFNVGSKIYLSKTREYSSAADYKETIFTLYDLNGNILEKYSPGEAREVYLWGYNKTYPVAKILGSDYGTIVGWVNAGILNNPSNDAALRSHLATIRSNLSNTIAQVESYTYKSLVGMTSSTDAKGKDSYYEYDHFMRLKNVKDQDGKIIKSYQYHYKP